MGLFCFRRFLGPLIMTRPRDSQRSRLYASEWECFGWPKMEFKDMQELEDYLWGVLENRYVQKKYQTARDIVSGTQKFKICNGAGHRRAVTHFEGDTIRVSFPRKMRCKWVVVHEIAHVVAPRDKAFHGREYARVYLHLVRIFFGAETQNKLKAAMKKHKCKYSKQHTPYKRPLTQEEKAAMVARLRKVKV